MGRRPAGAALADPGRRLRGLERRRQRGDHGARRDRRLARRGADRRARPGGVLRLPGHPADDPAHRGPDARGRLARERRPRRRRRRPPSATWCSISGIEPNSRWRTFAEAVHRGRRAARGRDGGHARRAARRRRPHPPGPDHRARLGSRARRAGSASAARATRGRPGSSASSTTPAGDAGSPRPASGRPSRTTSPRSPTRRRRWRCCAGSRAFTGIAIEASELEEAMEPLRDPGRPRRRLEPRDRGARPPARVRAGRGRRDRHRRNALRRRDRARLPALPAPALDEHERPPDAPSRGIRPRTPGRSAGSRTRSRSRARGGARSPGR